MGTHYKRLMQGLLMSTNNIQIALFFTDTRYKDKIRKNDNLTVTKPSVKRKKLVTNYARLLYLIL